MKNRSAQGKRLELEVRKILESEGYKVETAINKTIWIKGKIISISHDIFGVLDGIALKPDGSNVVFYQVTVHSEESHKIKRFQESGILWSNFDTRIYARVRDTRPPHFRIIEAKDGWEWTGKVAMVLKDEKI